MKTPTVASLKKVTPENLVRLGPERLAEILVAAAQTKPELKRRLRMELAAEQGPDHLVVEIDKRLASLETSRSKVSWRQRPTFVRDLDFLRVLIADKLAGLDPAMALDRLWPFMDVARRVGGRVKDKHGELAAVFDRAAGDLGRLVVGQEGERTAQALAEAIVRNPYGWTEWLPTVLESAQPALAAAALRRVADKPDATAAWMPAVRALADAAGDVDAFRSTFTAAALKTPSVAAEIAGRLLGAGKLAEAGRLLKAAGPGKTAEPDYEWETVWIDYLDQMGDSGAAQAARWSSFERTLSADRAKAFTTRLGDFDDVEAEGRAFDHAARHADVRKGLEFLMNWPALPEAARMIQARADDIQVSAEQAEAWAGKLRVRYPAAAELLLRKAAAAAFCRREFATSDRLTREADTLSE